MLYTATGSLTPSGEGEWQARKHGASRRQRSKIHIGIDAKALAGRMVKITRNRTG